MIGLMLLLALVIWMALTVGAMIAGYKIFIRFAKTRLAGVLGAFLGFMLTMGGIFVYWYAEYREIKQYADRMCSQAGLKIFVTPEQWKEMVGGEEAWKAIPYVNKLVDRKPPYPAYLVFENEKYKMNWQANDRIISYVHYDEQEKLYTITTKDVYYDVVSKKILVQSVRTSTRSTKFFRLDFWRIMPDCRNNPSATWKLNYIANIPYH